MQKNKLLDKLVLIIVSILTILIGVIFIIQICRIYYGNDKVYTSDICSKFLLEMLPIIVLWIITVIGSYVYFSFKNNANGSIAKITNAEKFRSDLSRI